MDKQLGLEDTDLSGILNMEERLELEYIDLIEKLGSNRYNDATDQNWYSCCVRLNEGKFTTSNRYN